MTATTPANDRPAEAAPQSADMADWTGADPITRVTRARQGQGQERTR